MIKLQKNNRVAIIGSGISGLSLAYFLKDQADITLFETQPRLGGHSRTLEINYKGKVIPVDTGFIVFNHRNYPNLTKFFSHLDVRTQKSDMSFGVSMNSGKQEWSANSLNAFFAQRSQLLNPKVWRGVYDILRFNKSALSYVEKNPKASLQNLLDEMKLGEWFRSTYLLPMGGAIWSASPHQMLEFPAKTFVEFFENHGLLTIHKHPQWYTVLGGSIEYIKKISKILGSRIKLSEGVSEVRRTNQGILLITNQNHEYTFDQVVFACHSDQVLEILKGPSLNEQEALKAIPYHENRAILHRDHALMPHRKKCWSSWNYLTDTSDQTSPISLTYWMNRLQNIDHNYPLFLTLNPTREIPEELIFDEHVFYHPVFGTESEKGKESLFRLQGAQNTWYCGAYLGNGFHEDGILSAYRVARAMGASLPW